MVDLWLVIFVPINEMRAILPWMCYYYFDLILVWVHPSMYSTYIRAQNLCPFVNYALHIIHYFPFSFGTPALFLQKPILRYVNYSAKMGTKTVPTFTTAFCVQDITTKIAFDYVEQLNITYVQLIINLT